MDELVLCKLDILKKLAKKYDLEVLVLFGSKAKNIGNKFSDFDFAYFSYKNFDFELDFKLKCELSEIFNTTKIDLINLNKQEDIVLRYEIFNNGICIYEKENGFFDNAQTNSWFNYIYQKDLFVNDNDFLKNSLEELVK